MPKENRREARIQAVQQLYGAEMRGVLVLGSEEKSGTLVGDVMAPFATDLLAITIERLTEIDELLGNALQNWHQLVLDGCVWLPPRTPQVHVGGGQTKTNPQVD